MTDAIKPETGEVFTEDEAREYSKLDRIIKKYSPRHAELNAKIKRVFDTPGKRTLADILIDVSVRNLKKAKDAETRYPVEKFPQYYKTVQVFDWDALPAAAQKRFTEQNLAVKVDVLTPIETVEE